MKFYSRRYISTKILIFVSEDQKDKDDDQNSASVQYITDRLIRKVSKQENLHFIERLDLTLSSREGYVKKIKVREKYMSKKQFAVLNSKYTSHKNNCRTK